MSVQLKDSHLQARKTALTRNWPWGHLDLNLQPPELWEVHFCCLSPAFVVFVRAAWADKFQELWKYPWGRDGPEPPIWTSTVPRLIRETTFVIWWNAGSMKVPRLHSSTLSLLTAVPLLMWRPCSQTLLGGVPETGLPNGVLSYFWEQKLYSPSKTWGQWNYDRGFAADLCFWKQVGTVGVWGH